MKETFFGKSIISVNSLIRVPLSEIFEILVWVFFAYLYSIRPITELFYRTTDVYGNSVSFIWTFQKIFLGYSTPLIISLLTVIFPFIFKFIYLKFPVHYLKNIRESANISSNSKKKGNNTTVSNNEQSRPYDFLFLDDERMILNEYLLQSNKLSEKILSKTNLYLFVGSMIALVGVFVFYAQSASDTKEFKDFPTFFSHSFPRLGTLIFIEAIAFFFLRQYRITMDEFRYYEAIKRQRENQIAIISIVKLFKNEKELLDKILVSLNLDFQPDKLNKDEASKILESQKINNNQNEIIDKFLEMLKLTK